MTGRKSPENGSAVRFEMMDTPDAVLRIAELIRRNGGRALLVGGCVRDSFLKVPVKDFDLEVYGLSPEAVQQTVRTEFELDSVGMSFGVFKVHHYEIDIALPRLENKMGAGHRGFIVESVPDLSYAEASARRDFTVNAIMKDPLTGEIIDPWDGRVDLEKKILRHVSGHFSEDPLRVLRGMQFVSRFEFQCVPETLKLCSQLSQEELAVERIGTEWEKMLLKAVKPSLGLQFLQDCGWIRYYPELQALIGCKQSPKWHPEGDVWTHTKLAMDQTIHCRSGNESDDLVTALAVLCHDFGKPAVTKTTPEGHITSIGHEAAGAAPAERFISRMWNRPDLIRRVLPLVRRHMQPVLFPKNHAKAPAYRRLAQKVGRLDLLHRVSVCDICARPPNEPDLESTDEFRKQAQALGVWESAPEPVIQGRHLIQLGIRPGPEMGQMLKACFEAQLEGRFTDVESGLTYFKQNLSDHRNGKPDQDQ